MKGVFCGLVLMLVFAFPGSAQHQEVPDKSIVYKGNENVDVDTTSLLHAFKTGSFQGHFRYFFMSTQNQKALTDYYANAAGGGIRYETARFHNFQMAVSGFYIFNIGSSDFTKADSSTGQYNRYEIGLFDQEDPANKKDLDRLEEFYLKYNFRKSNIAFGRQLINTPFINLQDGRMRPTGVEGIWAEVNEIKKTKLEFGWLYNISPRGTVSWYNMGKAVGVNPTGVNVDGSKALYAGNLKSSGVALFGLTHAINKNIKVQGWNMFAENVFNTALLRADITFALKNKSKLFVAAQVIRQDAVNDGGNADPSKTYFSKGQKSISFGGRAGWKNKQWETSINYNRVTAHGRYLVPREWGRDPFFTFMPRERNDGFGDVHAIMAKVDYQIPATRLKTSLAAGYYHLPDVKNYRLNKYGLPSYTHINADARYSFAKMLKGLEAQLLIAGKIKAGETYNNDKFVFNKVNMVQYNLVLNYHF